MHPAVLGATGYALLLSSFVTLLILLRLKCKRQQKKSSFYILSISDVLSAALTAIVLLVNHIETGIKMNYNWQNNLDDRTPNRTWTIGNQHQIPSFLKIHDPEGMDNTDFNVTLTCDMKNIFMQYGMLLAALTNAFVSLLTFVVQCNRSAACVKQRYASMMESSMKDAQLDSKDSRVARGRRMTKEEQESAPQRQSNATERSNVHRFVQRIVEMSKFRVLKENDERPVSYLVTAHWLVPFLVIGILYFAKYDDTNATRQIEDTECIFENNFPLNYFYVTSDFENSSKTVNSIADVTVANNYLFNEEKSNNSKPSNIEIDQVVSKVQDIVRIVLNDTRNFTKNAETINFRGDSSGSRNTMEHIITNDRIKKNDTNIDVVTQILYDAMNQTAASKEGEDVTEMKMSEGLTNVSEMPAQSKNDSHRETTQMYFTSTEENATHRITDIPIVRNTMLISNDQIYVDILKRIQAASVHSSAAKNRYDSRHNGKQPERNDLKSNTAKGKSYSIRHLSSSETDHFNRYINSVTERDLQINLQHTINKCLLSMNFLKLHLFVLFFAIYFLPILFSCILQMRAKHMCKNVLVMLKANVNLVSTSLHSDINSKINAVNTDEPPLELSHSTNDKESRRRMEESDTPEEINFTQSHSNGMDIEAIGESCENHIRMQECNQTKLKIDCVVRILDIIRLSLILCILLWTPMFLGTLLRVFSCTQVPRWWNSVTFSGAISFGIIRNALNISIIKIQEVCDDASAKENKVHPIK